MTKRQREQVVELLRCAADTDPDWNLAPEYGEPLIGTWDAGDWLDASTRVSDLAEEVYEAVADEYGDGHDWRTSLLEAAARVEEGSFP